MSNIEVRLMTGRHRGLRKSVWAGGLPILLGVGMLLSGTERADAQSRGLFGNSGAMGMSSTGSTGGAMSGGGRGVGSSGFGSAFGGSGTSSSGMGGASAFGNGASGMGGIGGSLGQSGFGGTGTDGQGSGLVGRRDTSGRFVGGTQTGQQSGGFGRGQTGQSGQFGRSQSNRGFGAGGQQGLGGQGSESAAPGAARLLHPQQRLGFAYQLPTSEATNQKLNTRFEKLTKRAALRGATAVKFEMQGSTLTMRGEVDSEETKRLVGMLAGLEPGVRKVENELSINAALPHAPGAPPSK